MSPGIFTAAQISRLSVFRSAVAATVGSGAMVAWSHDSADAAATAVGRQGTTVSVTATPTTQVDQFNFYSPTALGVGVFEFDLTNNGASKGIVIPKTNLAGLVFQLNGAAGGASLALRVGWTEE